MINTISLPKISDLIMSIFSSNHYISQGVEDKIWGSSNHVTFYVSKSCFALRMIVESWILINKCKKVSLWVPDFICEEGISQLYDLDVDIYFYKINKYYKFDINKNIDAPIPDILIMVHFFGIENNDIELLNYGKKVNALIIEDGAHLLRSTGNIGSYGDIIFFSPHKTLPIMQGSVISICSSLNTFLEVFSGVVDFYQAGNLSSVCSKKWIIKKIIQRFIPQWFIKFYPVKHSYKNFDKYYVPISTFSYNLLKRFTKERIDYIANIRKNNFLKIQRNLLCLPEVENVLFFNETDIPYMAGVLFKDEKSLMIVKQRIEKLGYFCSQWPLLPDLEEDSVIPIYLYKHTLFVSIHEDMPVKKLVNIISTISL